MEYMEANRLKHKPLMLLISVVFACGLATCLGVEIVRRHARQVPFDQAAWASSLDARWQMIESVCELIADRKPNAAEIYNMLGGGNSNAMGIPAFTRQMARFRHVKYQLGRKFMDSHEYYFIIGFDESGAAMSCEVTGD